MVSCKPIHHPIGFIFLVSSILVQSNVLWGYLCSVCGNTRSGSVWCGLVGEPTFELTVYNMGVAFKCWAILLIAPAK